MIDDKNSSSPGHEPIWEQKIKFRKWYWILIFSLIVLVAGGFILFRPEALYQTLAYLFGGGLLIGGVNKVFFTPPSIDNFGFKKKSYPWFSGTLMIVTALVLLMSPGLFMVALPVLLGAMMLMFSLFLLAITRNFSGTRIGQGLFIFGLMFLVTSITVFIYPETWGDILGRVTGVVLIGIGIAGLVLTAYLRKAEWDIASLYKGDKGFRRHK